MSKIPFRTAGVVSFLLLLAAVVSAQMPNPYGAPISLENAKKAAAPAIAEARKNNWTMAVSIVPLWLVC